VGGSVDHLSRGEGATRCTSALHAAGVRAQDLTLEITETLLVADRGAVRVLEQLRELGVSIVLDARAEPGGEAAALRALGCELGQGYLF
jgi:EAL domain-containing protein (putative c-di-GMP-specific phosphodiesterase class I)